MTSSFQSTAFQPAASPVDTFVAEPSVLPKTNAEELAGILSSVNPALQNYFGAEINEKKTGTRTTWYGKSYASKQA